MKTSNGFTNDSDFVHSDFIEQNLGIAIPYLIIISLCTLSGCVGNIMVIGCVLSFKVIFFSTYNNHTLFLSTINLFKFKFKIKI